MLAASVLRRVAVGLLLALGLVPLAQAQGFNSANGRNHPEIDWRVAETAHFRIMTPAHLPGLDAEAAAIAEETYASLSELLGVTFGEGSEAGYKLRIYLSDEDEIGNGFAAPVGVGYTAIWVHVNEVASRWTSREKWLRTVLAHELAHLIHFRAVGANPYSLIAGDPLPRFFTEGLAQYLTETWNPYRGERWLRTAVLDDRLSYEDGVSATNGALLYAVGNSQVRMLAETYGDTTLAAILAHREPGPLGIGRVHDFEEAFAEVVGMPYAAFREDWRRRINIGYNAIAARMEPTDALAPHVLPSADSVAKAEARAQGERIGMPGQYVYDVQVSPDGKRLAALVLNSLVRPVRRLVVLDRAEGGDPEDGERWANGRVVAEGALGEHVAWHPGGERLAYARMIRGDHGSLVDDVFEADLRGPTRRVTTSRRASLPTYSPSGDRLAFVVSERGTANVVIRDLATGRETRATAFTGDVQIGGLRWHPSDERLALARFAADGTRDVGLVDLGGPRAGQFQPLTDGAFDDHGPVWLPEPGAPADLAFVSLRDGVPNTFVLPGARAGAAPRRVTNVVTGATVRSVRADSARGAQLYVIAPESKTHDRVYRIPASRRPTVAARAGVPAPPAWQQHRPPSPISRVIRPDSTLIRQRYAYRPLRNLTHAFSVAVPYYFGPTSYGVFGTSTWIEPLGKHAIGGVAALNFGAAPEHSLVALSYVNNTLRPTITIGAYQYPGEVRPYGADVLAERFTGGEVVASLPINTIRPYTGRGAALRLRYRDVAPIDVGELDLSEGILPTPRGGQQADLTLSFTQRTQRPYRHNLVHPLDGSGVRATLLGSAKVLGGDAAFVRGDVSAFRVLPALGSHRLFVYARAQAQEGTILPQNVLGFTRDDGLRIGLPAEAAAVPFLFGDAERVRGYRRTALGDRLVFASAEYRVLLTPSLQTEVLGVVRLGATALALFADAGAVWTGDDFDGRTERLGLGGEIKNAISIGGLTLSHALGYARPYDAWGEDDGPDDLYYRIQAALPF